MDNWNNRTEEEKDREFAQEPTSLVENRKIPLPHLGFPHQEQHTLNIAKNKTTPSVQKEPEEPKVPKHPEKHTPSKSKDFLSR